MQAENPNVCVKIADEGVGIPADHLTDIGQPFFTMKEQGTGLGLMVTRKIVDAHHGEFTIDSVEGQGTTVSITLPAANMDDA